MIDAEMTKAAAPVKKLQEEVESLTNRQKALRVVSDRLNTFRSFLNDWKLQSNFFHNTATSSNEDVLTVSTSGPVSDTSFNVTVNNLSKNQAYFSSTAVSAENNTKLENLGGTGNGISGSGTLSLTVNGKSYDVDYYRGNTLEEITDQIESLDDNLHVYAVSSNNGLKVFFSGVDASVNLQMSDSGTLLESLNMTESLKSGGFVLGDPEGKMEDMGINTGQLTINVDGTDYVLDYDATNDDFNSWIDAIYDDPSYEPLLDKVSIYYGSNGQTGDDEAMKLFINAKNPESTLTIEESGAGNMLEMMRFFETYASAEKVTGDSVSTLDSLGLASDGILTFTVDGTDYDINYDADADTLTSLAAAINGTATLQDSVKANIVESGGKVQLVLSGTNSTVDFDLSDSGELLRSLNMTEEYASTDTVSGAATDTLSDLGVTDESGKITVNIDGNYRYINYDATASGDTLNDLVAKINAADSRLYAFVEESGGKLSLKIGSTEPDVDISLSDSGAFLKTFNIKTNESSGHHPNGHSENGYTSRGFQEAKQASATVDLNGISAEITSDTNTFQDVLQGINVTARQVSTSPVTVTVTQNVKETKNHIMEFVDEYNSVMDFLYERLYDQKDQVTTSSSLADSSSDDDLKKVLQNYLDDTTDLSKVLFGDTTLNDIFVELKSMTYQDLDNGGLEIYYSNSTRGTAESTLGELGVKLPTGTEGTLSIHVEGVDDPIQLNYSQSDTLQDIVDRLSQYSDYGISASIKNAGTGSFVFQISSSKDIVISDNTTSRYTGLKGLLLSNHGDTALKYDYLTDIGIGSSNGLNGYKDSYRNIMRGRLVVNEDLLEEALTKDSEAVWELFGISQTVAGVETDGFVTKLTNKIYDYNQYNTGKLQRIIGYGGTISDEIKDKNAEIVSWSSRLNRKFEALWKKYTALDSTIGKLQQQSAALEKAYSNMGNNN
jgi:flagellar capping protein FliD